MTRYLTFVAIQRRLIIIDFFLLGYFEWDLEILVAVNFVLVLGDDYLRIAQLFYFRQLFIHRTPHQFELLFETFSHFQNFICHLQRCGRHVV